MKIICVSPYESSMELQRNIAALLADLENVSICKKNSYSYSPCCIIIFADLQVQVRVHIAT